MPTSSFNDVPFGTAAAEAFLGLFPSIPVFASCTLISYHGAPDYVSAVSHLTSASTRYVQAQAVGNPAPSTATTESSPTQSPITQAPAASASAIQPVTIQAPPVPSPSTQPSTLPSPSTVSSGGSPTPSSVGPENTSANSQSPSFESHSTISAFSINPTSVQSSGSGSSGIISSLLTAAVQANSVVNPASAPVVGSQTLIPGSSAITITGTGTPISVHSSATEAPLGSSTLGFEGPIMSGIGGLPTSSVNASATPSQGGVVPFTGGSSGVKSLSVTVLLSICGMIEVLFL